MCFLVALLLLLVWVHCRRAAAVSVLQLPLDLGIRRGCPIEKPVDLRVNALTLSKKKKRKEKCAEIQSRVHKLEDELAVFCNA